MPAAPRSVTRRRMIQWGKTLTPARVDSFPVHGSLDGAGRRNRSRAATAPQLLMFTTIWPVNRCRALKKAAQADFLRSS